MVAGSILVVEDDPTLARAITRNLTARGYVAYAAATVAGATEAIVQDRPRLVLVDIDLPDGSGWEVLRTLRQIGDAGAAAIVMSALRPNPRLAGELGAVGMLEKPFPMESLLRLVARALDPQAEAPPLGVD